MPFPPIDLSAVDRILAAIDAIDEPRVAEAKEKMLDRQTQIWDRVLEAGVQLGIGRRAPETKEEKDRISEWYAAGIRVLIDFIRDVTAFYAGLKSYRPLTSDEKLVREELFSLVKEIKKQLQSASSR